jgi:ABC exporter DevB family membrane fusion protein
MVSAPAEPAKPGVTLACPGRVEGRSETFEVGAAADGLVKAVYVKEGQQVARGTKLAEIDCPDLQASFEEAKSQTESARQVKARLMRGSRDEERLSAEQRTVAAKAVLEEAAAHMKRMKELHDSGIMARADLDSVKRDYDVAEAKLREAIRNEELVKAPALAEEVAKADSDIASSEHRMEIVQEKMSKCVVTAPINGAILRVLMKAGESFSTLRPRPLFTMADLSVRRIRAEVDERDVSKVRVGQKVVISSDALQNQLLQGVVGRISDTMGRKRILTGDPSEKADRDVLEAMIDLDAAVKLPVGMRVTVQFQEMKTPKPEAKPVEAKPAPAPVTVAPPAPPPAPLPVAPPPNVAARPGNAEEHHRKGRDLLQKGQYRAAIDELSQAIAAKPDLALAWNARGYAYLILRDHASAIQNFDRAIELNPKYANAYRNRGAARKAAGDAPGAAADLERAKQLEK